MRMLCTILLAVCLGLTSCGDTTPPEPPRNSDGSRSASGLIWDVERGLEVGSDWIPKNETFTDVVTAIHVSRSGQSYLNFGGKYPNQLLSVWLPKSYTSLKAQAFLKDLPGKTVTVTGDFRYYEGKPEMVIRKVSQIIVVDPVPEVASAR
jgi:hypothetical protein